MSSSKRLCISLIQTPSRCQRLPQCSLQTAFITARDDHHRQRNHVQRRPFTSTPTHHAGSMSAQRQMKMRVPSQPSISVTMKAQQKAAMRDGSLLEQFGLLPGTVVPPTGAKLPSWIKDPRGRLRLEWYKFYKSVHVLGMTLWFAKWAVRPTIKLERGKAVPMAKGLYEDMYTHFASGDLSPIENKLSPGLMGSLRARIAQRPANTYMRWTLEKYLSSPKLIWFHSAMIDPKRPKDDQTGMFQAVVRIHSRQRLQKVQRVMGKDRQVREVLVDAEGKEVHEDEMERERRRSIKDTVEYVVLQRSVKKSRPGPWLIWGTTEEMTLAGMKKSDKRNWEAAAAAQKQLKQLKA